MYVACRLLCGWEYFRNVSKSQEASASLCNKGEKAIIKKMKMVLKLITLVHIQRLWLNTEIYPV